MNEIQKIVNEVIGKPRFDTLEDVADFLEGMDDGEHAKCGFDMKKPYPMFSEKHPCGTACCIGGWITAANEMVCFNQGLIVEFNMSKSDSWNLCYPGIESAYHANPVQAAKVIRNYISTGVVDWAEVMGDAA